MKTTGDILSIHIDIPKSELSIFEFLAKKMGWKIDTQQKNTEVVCDIQDESKQFFENSKRSMAEHIQKYL